MTVDEYLQQVPEPQRSTLTALRTTLREVLPDAQEVISYNLPAFKVEGKAIAGYGAFKNHCSYFPHSGSVIPTLADELEGYEWNKGTLRFAIDEPLPKALVIKLVSRRFEQLGMSPDGSTET
jgi:uncharacterized protein YdhG (YjbR/CyaY superfamily)